VHLLESSAFASEFKNAVIVKIGPAARVLFRYLFQPSKTPLTNFNHFPPAGCNSIYILLPPYAHNSCSIKGHQLSFELSGLIVEGGTQIFREGQEPTVKFGKHCSPKLLNVRFSKARHLENSLSCSAQIVNQEAQIEAQTRNQFVVHSLRPGGAGTGGIGKVSSLHGGI